MGSRAVLHVLDRAPGQQPDRGLRADRVEQDLLQVGPVNDPIGRAEALPHGRPERHLAEVLARPDRADDHPVRLRGDPAQSRTEPEIDEDPARIGRELKPGANFAEPRAALDERDGVSLLRQGEGGCEPADAGADDREGQP